MKRLVSLLGALAASLIFLPSCGQAHSLDQRVSDPVVAAMEKKFNDAQSQPSPAIVKLHFMAGNWRCVTRKAGKTYVEHINYSFSPGGRWMVERELGPTTPNSWEVQVWGYDAVRNTFKAYQFLDAGLRLKTISGWQNGKFVSQRDDSGETVDIVPKGKNAFNWVISSPDGRTLFTQVCTRG